MEFPPFMDDIDKGRKMWETPLKSGKTYADCLPNGGKNIAGNYPMFDDARGKVITLHDAINDCRVANGEEAYKVNDMKTMGTLTAYMRTLSDGMLMNIKVEGPKAMEAWNAGKKTFYTRKGQLNFACASCHVQNGGNYLRSELLSPPVGHATHWPVFRFLQVLAAAAASGLVLDSKSVLAGNLPAHFYDMPASGQCLFLHFTDCHAQLMPIWFREPNVNLGVGASNGKVPHLVGDKFLKHYGIKPGTADAAPFTYIDFDTASKAYGRVGGFAHLKTLVDKMRASRPGALLLDGGDTWQGSATSLWTKAQDMVDACIAARRRRHDAALGSHLRRRPDHGSGAERFRQKRR
jgi:sulfur oxidation c-type cytochrome SoxA